MKERRAAAWNVDGTVFLRGFWIEGQENACAGVSVSLRMIGSDGALEAAVLLYIVGKDPKKPGNPDPSALQSWDEGQRGEIVEIMRL